MLPHCAGVRAEDVICFTCSPLHGSTEALFLVASPLYSSYITDQRSLAQLATLDILPFAYPAAIIPVRDVSVRPDAGSSGGSSDGRTAAEEGAGGDTLRRQQEALKIRDPSQLVVGVPAVMATQWRHEPHHLVNSSIQ